MPYEAPLVFRVQVRDTRYLTDAPFCVNCSTLTGVHSILKGSMVRCPAATVDALLQNLPTKAGEANLRTFGTTQIELIARTPTPAEAAEFFAAALDHATEYAERVDTAAAWDVVAGFQESLEAAELQVANNATQTC